MHIPATLKFSFLSLISVLRVFLHSQSFLAAHVNESPFFFFLLFPKKLSLSAVYFSQIQVFIHQHLPSAVTFFFSQRTFLLCLLTRMLIFGGFWFFLKISITSQHLNIVRGLNSFYLLLLCLSPNLKKYSFKKKRAQCSLFLYIIHAH